MIALTDREICDNPTSAREPLPLANKCFLDRSYPDFFRISGGIVLILLFPSHWVCGKLSQFLGGCFVV